ncbi:MAG: hypothetical protein QXE05_05915 [Nitrososphaeria archaeon]
MNINILVFNNQFPKEKAVEVFKKYEKKSRKLSLIELIYIPFWLLTFQLTIEKFSLSKLLKVHQIGSKFKPLENKINETNIKKLKIEMIADALLGYSAFFSHNKTDNIEPIKVEVDEIFVLKPIIEDYTTLLESIKKEIKKRIFSIHLWSIKNFNIYLENSRLVYIPFWVGYYKESNSREEKWSVEVINSLTGQAEEAWYKKIFYKAILSQKANFTSIF